MSKIKYLDGLRGLAAYVVVLAHFGVAFYPAFYTGSLAQTHTKNKIEILLGATPFNLVLGGNFAVCIFFVLSGYVLTYRFFKEKDSQIIISSAVKRYFRLVVPVLFAMLIAYVMMSLSLFYNHQIAEQTKSTWWLAKFWNFEPRFMDFMNQALFGVFFKYKNLYLNPLWTMTYEFFGSFLVFGLALLCGKLKNRFVIYAIIGLFFLQTYYVNFVIGLFLSDLFNNRLANNSILKSWKNSVLNFLLIFSGLFFGSYPTGLDVSQTFYRAMKIKFLLAPHVFYHSLGAFLIVVALLNSEKLKSFFSNDILSFLGKISFSMYLLHLIVLCSFSCYLFSVLYRVISYNFAFIITFIISNGVIFLVSYLMYRYIDKNALLFSQKIYETFFK